MNKIAAVIVTFNRKELLQKCIKYLKMQTYQNFDVLVIDNASTDGTEELISEMRTKNSNLFYYNTGANLGGAGGFSYGIRLATQKNYDYLWIMDDDTIPKENALKELVDMNNYLKGNYGFLSSYAEWIDGTPCEMNVPTISLKWRENISEQFQNNLIRLDSASFVSMFIPTNVIRKVGLPIKEFFIWGDDVEYSRRISSHFPCYFVYKSQVVHEMKRNEATTIVDEDGKRLGRYEYLYRNRYYIAKRQSKREKILFWIGIKNTLKDINKSSCSDKGKRKRIVLKSCLKGLLFNPKIEYVSKK